MYKIPKPQDTTLDRYCSKYRNSAISKIVETVADLENELSQHRPVEPNVDLTSFYLLLKILRWLCSGNNIDCLLRADMSKMKRIIEFTGRHFPDFRTNPRQFPEENLINEWKDKYLNAIFKDIFITYMYDTVLDKTEFINDLDLSVCPYCGASSIKTIRKPNGTEIKAQIDHYFPKSKYPFLAMNYYNLIPCCNKCNTAPNKGVLDPLGINGEELLPFPYTFEDQLFKFECTYDLSGIYNAKNFISHIEYGDNFHMRQGYNDIIAIEPQYEKDNEMQKIWRKLSDSNEKYQYFCKILLNQPLGDADTSIFAPTFIGTMGYDLNDDNSRIYEKYKFSKDIYAQMSLEIQKQNE